MPRPKVAINPKHAGILTEILNREGISQVAFARRINLSAQAITEIRRGRANITQSTAEEIVKAFPQYNLNWLLGNSEYPTEPERVANEIKNLFHQLGDETDAVEKLNAVLGYAAVFPKDARTDEPIRGQRVSISFNWDSTDDEILSLAHSTPAFPTVVITGPDGTQAHAYNDEYQNALQDIANYARIRMRLLFEKEDGTDGLNT